MDVPHHALRSDFAKAYAKFLTDLKSSGTRVNNIAVVNENTDYGTSVSASILDAAKAANIPVAAQIAYSANSSRRHCAGASA